MKLAIKQAKIWRTGSGSAVITVPSDYVTNGQLIPGKEYDVEIDTGEDS